MSDNEANLEDAVAIVSMACRLPGARDAEEFWANLVAGKESIRRFSPAELENWGVPEELSREPDFVPAGAVVEGAEDFDAGLFGLTPREAQLTDPQFRVFLECCWQALELAGQARDRYRGRAAVFAGCGDSGYTESLGDIQAKLAQGADFLSTLVSYKLNLRGPSLTVQTACSSSLVAVHLAVRSLLEGECDLALAGGVSITWPQRIGHLYLEGGIYSQDGHCRPFDAAASGTVGGNGAGVVLLKRLEDALEEGDVIRAVVRGSAINNDGAAKVGFTAPSVQGQAEVIREALAVAGVSAESVGYVEGHGTGTPLGDPIEVAALTEAFRGDTDGVGFCGLGSVKSNLGHLDTAAGVVGLIKAALCLERAYLPPSLHFQDPNPKLDLAASPFYVVQEGQPWKDREAPRRAAVSSFGMGGTNAHVVLEEAPPRASFESSPESSPAVAAAPQVLPLSALTETGLALQEERLAAFLSDHRDVSLEDVAHTLQVGRKSFAWRRAIVCAYVDTALSLLAPGKKRSTTAPVKVDGPPVAFLFPGQGGDLMALGRELYDSQPVFRREIDHGCEAVQPHLDFDLRQFLISPLNAESSKSNAQEVADRTRTSRIQPALVLVELALARLWMHWGLLPQALLGHSLGEYAAACLAGVFSLEEALQLVSERGRLMEALPSGGMLAVPLGEQEVLASLPPELALAAINGEARCVVSGSQEALQAYASELSEEGVASRPLKTDRAFHSPAVEAIMAPFAACLGRVELKAPRIPVVSNVTGGWLTEAEATSADYWLRHLRQPVRFREGLNLLLEEPHRQLLEVGPQATLTSLARPETRRRGALAPIASLGRGKGEAGEALLKAVGQLWQAGVEPHWQRLTPGGRRMALPTYPFERQSFQRQLSMAPQQQQAVPAAVSDPPPSPGESPRPLAPVAARAAAPEDGGSMTRLELLIHQQLEVIENQLVTFRATDGRGEELGGSSVG